MNITISKHATELIKKASKNYLGKTPTVCVFNGGCAGTMLGITFLESNNDMDTITLDGVVIAISKEVSEVADDVSIDVKSGILPELIVRNNSAKVRCKCGKSFKV